MKSLSRKQKNSAFDHKTPAPAFVLYNSWVHYRECSLLFPENYWVPQTVAGKVGFSETTLRHQ